MRVANCRSVRYEIEEADLGKNLAPSVMEHLADCGQCQSFYDERRKLRQLVASLEAVEAPPDFDLRVRARIAHEKVDTRSGSIFSNFTFGFPSAALATLVVVIVGVFAFRAWNAPAPNMTAVQTEMPEATKPSRQSEQQPATASGLRANGGTGVLSARDDSREAIRPGRPSKKKSQLRGAVSDLKNLRNLTTREFSSTPAPVVKKEEEVASLESPLIFPIETTSQPLRLSLDYSGGVSRTISVPAFSFGSEKVLTGGSSLVKNSPKGAW